MDMDRARAANGCRICARGRYDGQGCGNPWHRVPGPRMGAPVAPAAAVLPQAQRVRAMWEEPGFVDAIRQFAEAEPEQFQQAGFATGPA